MSDRELLEKAAKAAGIELQWPRDPSSYKLVEGIPPRRKDTWENWSPLTDDGDALRLAVALGISIAQEVDRGDVYADVFGSSPTIGADEPFGNCPCVATRRAIVRAAAAIGQSMEGKK